MSVGAQGRRALRALTRAGLLALLRSQFPLVGELQLAPFGIPGGTLVSLTPLLYRPLVD